MSLSTPHSMVEKLQSSLQAKAKSEPSYRFCSLWQGCPNVAVLEADKSMKDLAKTRI